MSDASGDTLVFNGLDVDSGEYLLPPLPIADVADIAKGKRLDEERLNVLKSRRERDTKVLGPVADVDPKDLGQTGWGIIFRGDIDPTPIKDALKELLDLRREQANKVKDYYKEYTRHEGVFPDQTALDWLVDRGAGPGPADPEKVPYYLLIIGSPEEIPYQFQYDLDVQYAVGRLHFDTLEEYAQYARSVVAAERGQIVLPRQVRVFGVDNPDDQSTRLSRQGLVEPLAGALASKMTSIGWDVQAKLNGEANKEHLARLLGGDETPSLLFTASHGAGFVKFETPEQQERQLRHQGALVCQDWPGPEDWRGPLKQDFYFSADDVSDNAKLQGLIAFLFACYGAGTPRLDDFAHKKGITSEPQPIAPQAFIARLPQRLLGHPKGGALAVVGHVERATGYSFNWPESGSQTAVFESALTQLMRGHPIGSALEFFNQRYAELSTTLSQLQISITRGRIPDNNKLTRIWTANNDARSYIILGDPAVRLPVGDVTQATRRTFEEPVRVSSTPSPPPTPSTAPGDQPPSVRSVSSADFSVTTQSGQPFKRSTAEGVEFGGLFDGSDSKDQSRAGLRQPTANELENALKHVAAKIIEYVEAAAEMRVETRYIETIAGAAADNTTSSGNLGATREVDEGRLAARTVVKLDGDSVTTIPMRQAPAGEQELDTAILDQHQRNVSAAIEYRARMLDALIGLLRAGGRQV